MARAKLHYPATLAPDGEPVGNILNYAHISVAWYPTVCGRYTDGHVTTTRARVSCKACRHMLGLSPSASVAVGHRLGARWYE